MSYAEAMAKHYQDKRKDDNMGCQVKHTNTYIFKNGATAYSNVKLDSNIASRVNELVRKNGNNRDYFIDSPIYTDEYMKSFNNKIADVETVDELATYLGELDEEIEVLYPYNHDDRGLKCEQWVLSDGIHLKTYFYI